MWSKMEQAITTVAVASANEQSTAHSTKPVWFCKTAIFLHQTQIRFPMKFRAFSIYIARFLSQYIKFSPFRLSPSVYKPTPSKAIVSFASLSKDW